MTRVINSDTLKALRRRRFLVPLLSRRCSQTGSNTRQKSSTWRNSSVKLSMSVSESCFDLFAHTESYVKRQTLTSGFLIPNSGYDREARYRNKRGLEWRGYAVQWSETCEVDAVHLITHVKTTPANVAEVKCTEAI